MLEHVALARAQEQLEPKLLRSNPQPAYPLAAGRAGVEGTVEYSAAVNGELKLPTERVDEDHQLMITGWMKYRPELPDARDLRLRAGQLPDSVQFHHEVHDEVSAREPVPTRY
jgi:hypothetical protein